MQTDLSCSEIIKLMLRKIGDYFLNSNDSEDCVHNFFLTDGFWVSIVTEYSDNPTWDVCHL